MRWQQACTILSVSLKCFIVPITVPVVGWRMLWILPTCLFLWSRNSNHKSTLWGSVAMGSLTLFFDGAQNVQTAGSILAAWFPYITVGHGAEHVVSLFFKDVFTKVEAFKSLSLFSKRCRNVFGSTRHGPHALFKKQSMIHNKNTYIGFIKISECRMAGELIGLLGLLRLRPILRATISSKEFQDNWAKTFRRECLVLENNEFWKYLFTLCRSLYAPN